MRISILAFCFGLLICSNISHGEPVGGKTEAVTNAMAALESIPGFEGRLYCCESVVQAVNNLKRLGKKDALITLRRYVGDRGGDPISEESENVLIVCRLLFINPQGWAQPRMGEPYPDANQHAVQAYPLFPLAVSHGVPFLLISGYNLSGYTDDSADKCLKCCEGFDLITNELSEQGYADAERALVNSDEFKSLYTDTNVVPYVKKMIFEQSLCSDPRQRTQVNGESSIEIKIWSVPQTNH